MHMSGWVPVGPGIEPFGDWVILRMTRRRARAPRRDHGARHVPGAGGDALRVGPGGRRRGGRRRAGPPRPAREAGRRGLHPAVRQPGAGRGRHLDHVRGARLDVRRGRRRVRDPGAHRVARGAPARAGPGGRDGRGARRRGRARRGDRAAVRGRGRAT